MSKMADNVLDRPPTDWNPDDIGQFRFEQFTRLGFGAELCAFLADTKIDLHVVQGWINRGATPLQAVRLEAGRDWHEDDPMFDHKGFDRLMEAQAIPPDAPPLDPAKAKFLDFIS